MRSSAEEKSDVYRAIADDKRRRILDLLAEGDKPVQALVAEFDVSFAAISQHLRVLRESGLVTKRVEGRQHLYSARLEALEEVHSWTARYRSFWRGRLAKLRTHLEGQ